jgi:hypothetical protein
MSNRYIVVKEETIEAFQQSCSEKLDQGYVPLGGLVTAGNFYLQSFEQIPENSFEHYTGSFDVQTNY